MSNKPHYRREQSSNVYHDSVLFLETFDGISVVAQPGETNESLIRRFRVRVHKSRVLSELKFREYAMSQTQKEDYKRSRNRERQMKEAALQRKYDKENG